MGRRPTTVQVGRPTAMDRAGKPRTVQGASFFKVLFVDFAQKMVNSYLLLSLPVSPSHVFVCFFFLFLSIVFSVSVKVC